MNNIIYKGKEIIEKLFNRPTTWKELTVSNDTGFHKISLSKNVFGNSYTIKYVAAGKIEKMKKKISLVNISDNKLSIEELGVFTIENTDTKIFSSDNRLILEEEMYNKSAEAARLKQEKFDKALKEQEEKDARELQKQQEEERISAKREDNYNRKEKLINASLNIITAKKVNDSWHEYGYKADGSYGTSSETYGLKFVIKELIRFSEVKGFNGFDDNRLIVTLDKIRSLQDEVSSWDEEFDNKLNEIYVLHGYLIQELVTRTNNLCSYIKENDIDVSFSYYESNSWSNPLDCYQKSSETITIDNEFEKLLDAISLYIENITGENIRNEFESKLQKQR